MEGKLLEIKYSRIIAPIVFKVVIVSGNVMNKSEFETVNLGHFYFNLMF